MDDSFAWQRGFRRIRQLRATSQARWGDTRLSGTADRTRILSPSALSPRKFEAKEAPLRLTYGPSRACLLAGVLFYGAATSLAQTGTAPSSSTPGEAIPGTLGVSPFAGSVPGKLVPGVMPLSLRDAIDRGLKQNLGALLSNTDIRSARGQRWEQLSALLPHVTAAP